VTQVLFYNNVPNIETISCNMKKIYFENKTSYDPNSQNKVLGIDYSFFCVDSGLRLENIDEVKNHNLRIHINDKHFAMSTCHLCKYFFLGSKFNEFVHNIVICINVH